MPKPPMNAVAISRDVRDQEPNQPIEQERVEPRAQARRTQLEQYALGRLGGHDRVEHVVRHRPRVLRLDDDRVGYKIVNALLPHAENEQGIDEHIQRDDAEEPVDEVAQPKMRPSDAC